MFALYNEYLGLCIRLGFHSLHSIVSFPSCSGSSNRPLVYFFSIPSFRSPCVHDRRQSRFVCALFKYVNLCVRFPLFTVRSVFSDVHTARISLESLSLCDHRYGPSVLVRPNDSKREMDIGEAVDEPILSVLNYFCRSVHDAEDGEVSVFSYAVVVVVAVLSGGGGGGGVAGVHCHTHHYCCHERERGYMTAAPTTATTTATTSATITFTTSTITTTTATTTAVTTATTTSCSHYHKHSCC